MTAPPRFEGARWRGEGHRARNQPCCDALLIPRHDKRLSGFVLCDGAGGRAAVARSAQLSAQAGWRALLQLNRCLERAQQQRRSIDLERWRRPFLAAFWHHRRPGPIADHTLLACLWHQRRLLVAQVGDSSLLLRRQGRWQLALPPARGEYANETTFLRPDTRPQALQLWLAPAATIEALIGFSDGLEAAFLDGLQPHAPLAELVLEEHRRHRGWHGYRSWLADSLADPALAALSDDDRTLVVAAREQGPGQPPGEQPPPGR